jgi:signal transduction histidine kinase
LPPPGEPYPLRTASGEGPGARLDEDIAWRKDGSCFPVRYTSSPIRDEEGAVVGAVVAFNDISERKKLEEQLRQSQKMDALGQLAGGIAHDFNNLLTIINGFGEVVLSSLNPDDPAHELVGEMKKAGERAAGLSRQLLAFSRKTVLSPKVLDLDSVVIEMEKMLRRIIGEDITLTTGLPANLGRVHADPGQIEQVLLNLVVNARDAMPHGGRMTIETRNVDLDEEYARTHPEVCPGRYVLLEVRDTGCGMTEEVKGRIFEPFFTTKAAGRGTGLGLAIVYGIIRQSGGHIAVESSLGQGTTFRIYLPRIEDAIVEESSTGFAALARGTETVLVVEDDDGVRALIRHLLHRLGYTVLVAASGTEALEVARQHHGAIDLLLSDVVMPGMNGVELSRRLQVHRPGVKVLYLSGHVDEAVVGRGVLAAETAILKKPFTVPMLAQKIREVLAGSE